MSTLPDRLRDLADHAPERLPERDLWSAGRRRRGAGQLGGVLVTLPLALALTEAEVAHLLNISVGTVKSQSADAMTRLRGILKAPVPLGRVAGPDEGAEPR